MEITEEEEEEQREKKRQSTVKEEERPKTPGPDTTSPPADSPSSPPPVTLNSDFATTLAASNFATTTEPHTFTGVPRPSSPAKSFDDATRRQSYYPARPDLYSYSSYTYGKPRVKLGPRPSLDVGGRPRTSAGTDNFRPVATMPTGLKLSKGSRKGRSQDKTLDEAESPPIKEETTDTLEIAFLSSSIPENRPLGSGFELTRPHTSGGGVPSLSSSAAMKSNMPSLPTLSTKLNTMSPEKARLMKAKKLREMKKMNLPPSGSPAAEGPAEPSIPGLLVDGKTEAATADTMADQEELVAKNDGDADSRLSMSNADSGVAIDAPNDHGSVDTRMDSHPTSPIASSSDIGDSTKASSLSETTDETVQVDHEQKDSYTDIDGNEDRETEIASGADQTSNKPEDDGADQRLPTENQVDETEATVCEDKTMQADEEVKDEEVEVKKGEPATQSAAIPISKFASVSSSQVAETEVIEDVGSTEPPTKVDCVSTSGDGIVNGEPLDSSNSPRFAIPLSRFSTQETRPPSGTTPSPVPAIITPLPEAEQEGPAQESKWAKEKGTSEADETASIETRRSKRKVLVDPIRTDLPERTHSEANLSDDDDLMDELQSATLQQAQPMTVSKSPITSVFPGPSPQQPTADLDSITVASQPLRAVSNPLRTPLLTPPDLSSSSARAVSSGAAFLHKITQQSSSNDLRPKTPKLGSSISQRIKALEMLSGSAASGDSASKERTSSSFFSVRKTSIREPSRSPSVVERASSMKRGTTPSPPHSQESSPDTARPTRCDRSGSMASRLSMFEGGSVPRGRPESIQVTARIVRDPSQPFPKVPELKADATAFGYLELRQSPLVVDHQRADHAAFPTQREGGVQAEGRQSLLERRLSKDRRSQSQDRVAESTKNDLQDETEPINRPRRRSSLTIVKDFIKDRRDSLLGARSPSTDNLHLNLHQPSGNLASPAVLTPSRSPSRPPSVHQNSIFPRRLSISSRRSSVDQKSPALPTAGLSTGPLSPSLMTEASGESDGDDNRRFGSGSSTGATSPNPGTKGNRASRFMRRLSNSLSSSRKNVTPSISPTVTEEDDAEVAAQSGEMVPPSRGSLATGYLPPSIVSYMGDVNVQFPDNLLWKRRTMCLDSQGFLILSTVQGVSPTVSAAAAGAGRDRHLQAGAIKRYHLSDFRAPYTPEMEVQELPNSVVLDFVDGSGLQIACEDRAGQLNVLHSEFCTYFLCSSSLTFSTRR